MRSLGVFAWEKLSSLELRLLRRSPVVTERQGDLLRTQWSPGLLSFSGEDYLNLSHHPPATRPRTAAQGWLRFAFTALRTRKLNGFPRLCAATC